MHQPDDVVSWPILDHDMTRAELVAGWGLADVHDYCAETYGRVPARIEWEIVPAVEPWLRAWIRLGDRRYDDPPPVLEVCRICDENETPADLAARYNVSQRTILRHRAAAKEGQECKKY